MKIKIIFIYIILPYKILFSVGNTPNNHISLLSLPDELIFLITTEYVDFKSMLHTRLVCRSFVRYGYTQEPVIQRKIPKILNHGTIKFRLRIGISILNRGNNDFHNQNLLNLETMMNPLRTIGYYELGNIYNLINFNEGNKWYLESAEIGYKKAQLKIAEAYYHGIGTDKKLGEAHKWYLILAQNGDIESKNFLLNTDFSEHEWDQNLNQPHPWYLELANQGDALAQFKVANIYGKYEVNQIEAINKAIYWYKKAAEQNHIEAQFRIAYLIDIYAQTQEKKHAIHYYLLASQNLHSKAQNRLKTLLDNPVRIIQRLVRGGLARNKAKKIRYGKMNQRLRTEVKPSPTIPSTVPEGIKHSSYYGNINYDGAMSILEILRADKAYFSKQLLKQTIQNKTPMNPCIFEQIRPQSNFLQALHNKNLAPTIPMFRSSLSM